MNRKGVEVSLTFRCKVFIRQTTETEKGLHVFNSHAVSTTELVVDPTNYALNVCNAGWREPSLCREVVLPEITGFG